jgi:hypothetical protein
MSLSSRRRPGLGWLEEYLCELVDYCISLCRWVYRQCRAAPAEDPPEVVMDAQTADQIVFSLPTRYHGLQTPPKSMELSYDDTGNQHVRSALPGAAHSRGSAHLEGPGSTFKP